MSIYRWCPGGTSSQSLSVNSGAARVFRKQDNIQVCLIYKKSLSTSQGEFQRCQQALERNVEFILCIVTQIFAHEFWIESIKSGGNGRMRSKDISSSRDIQGEIERCL